MVPVCCLRCVLPVKVSVIPTVELRDLRWIGRRSGVVTMGVNALFIFTLTALGLWYISKSPSQKVRLLSLLLVMAVSIPYVFELLSPPLTCSFSWLESLAALSLSRWWLGQRPIELANRCFGALCDSFIETDQIPALRAHCRGLCHSPRRPHYHQARRRRPRPPSRASSAFSAARPLAPRRFGFGQPRGLR